MCSFVDVGFVHQGTKATAACTVATSAVPKVEPTQKLKEELQIIYGFSGICVDAGALCRQGRVQGFLGDLDVRDRQGIEAESNSYASLLHACASMTALAQGKRVHACMAKKGMEQNIYLATELISMYVKCGCLVDARQVFDKMHKRNVFSWTAMMGGYARQGWWEEVLSLFYQMQEEGLQLDHFIFPKVLKACSNLEALQQGKEVHGHIITRGFESNAYVANTLIDMYVKCGCMDSAHQVFDKMSQRDVVSWNMMISGYFQRRQGNEALELFRQMQLAGMEPDEVTWNAMITGYAQNGYTDEALKVFDRMQQSADVKPNVVSWSAMIAGCAQNGQDDEALNLFSQMQLAGIKPNTFTITCVLSACAHVESLQYGMEIHSYTIKNGFESDVQVANALIHMYGKCGTIERARELFDQMSQKDVISWNAMIAGYAQIGYGEEAIKLLHKMQLEGVRPDVITWNGIVAGYAHNGHWDQALKLFHQMQLAGTKPDSTTISIVLSACTQLEALQQGKEIHDYIIRRRFDLHAAVASALVAMYGRCGNIEDACKVFDSMSQRDVASWNAMIAGYAQNGHGDCALKCLQHMQMAGVEPNLVTMVSVLPACAHLTALQQGKEIHGYIVRNGFDLGIFVWNALIDMYAKCGIIEDAYSVFDRMPQRDVASWNAMIVGYGMHGHGEDAINLFRQMQQGGMRPNYITFTCALSACK